MIWFASSTQQVSLLKLKALSLERELKLFRRKPDSLFPTSITSQRWLPGGAAGYTTQKDAIKYSNWCRVALYRDWSVASTSPSSTKNRQEEPDIGPKDELEGDKRQTRLLDFFVRQKYNFCISGILGITHIEIFCVEIFTLHTFFFDVVRVETCHGV